MSELPTPGCTAAPACLACPKLTSWIWLNQPDASETRVQMDSISKLTNSAACGTQERRVAMTVSQAALYDEAVQRFRSEAVSSAGL